MKYDINIREEVFGATVTNIKTGKRDYVTKEELKKILEEKILPTDFTSDKENKNYNIKFLPLDKNANYKHFSFADIVYIELTRACNLRCKHCLNDSGTIMPNQLNIEEFTKLIKDLANSGIQEIRFTGGEPLLFKEIYKLIKLASDYGIVTSLGTNGTLITDDIAIKLKEAGLKKAVVSIDGTKNQHDIIRGEGSFEKALEGVYKLKEQNIRVRINSVIMRSNIEDVIALAKDMHKKKMPMFIRRFIESGRGTNLKNFTLSEKDYEEVVNKLDYELKNGPYVNGHYLRNNEGLHPRIKIPFEIKGCKAGQRAIAIMPDGSIYLCGFLASQGSKSIENVRNINDWKMFWNKLQGYDRLDYLRKKLESYNNLPNVQKTYCLAYVKKFINEE